jgi:hypothetical protein
MRVRTPDTVREQALAKVTKSAEKCGFYAEFRRICAEK